MNAPVARAPALSEIETDTHPGIRPGADAGTIALSDGAVVPYRPIRRSDLAALQRFHRGLSDQTVYFRFFGPMPELSEARARYFTHLDEENRFALVGLHPARTDDLIAVARFDREPGTDRAEYAAVVSDPWQGRGLGLALTRRLIEVARARGIRSLYAIVLPENARMLNLLRDLGLPERADWVDGIERVEVDVFAPDGRQLEPVTPRVDGNPLGC